MKTLYGVQLGNYLLDLATDTAFRVNSMTKKKVGYLDTGDGEERYLYIKSVDGIPLATDILEWAKKKDYIDQYTQSTDGLWFIIPSGTGNLYRISYFHQLQNILELHNQRIEWEDWKK